jgi:molybdate transport system permease protein
MSRTQSPQSSRSRQAGPSQPQEGETVLRSLFILPTILLAAFVGLPLLVLIARALMTGDVLAQLTQPLVLSALRLSALTSAASLMVIILIGTPAAYVLARSTFPGKRLLDTLIDVPLALPPVVVGVALLLVFGRLGLIGRWLQPLGIEIAFTTLAVVLAQVFVAAPFYVRSAKIGFTRIDPELEEIAVTLGASMWQTLRYVTLPLAWPALVGGAVLSWARALGEFGATIMFAGNFTGRTQTMPLAIMTALESDLQTAIVLATLLVIATFVALFLFRWIGRRFGDVW